MRRVMAQVDVPGVRQTQHEGGPVDTPLLEVLACPACFGGLRGRGTQSGLRGLWRGL